MVTRVAVCLTMLLFALTSLARSAQAQNAPETRAASDFGSAEVPKLDLEDLPALSSDVLSSESTHDDTSENLDDQDDESGNEAEGEQRRSRFTSIVVGNSHDQNDENSGRSQSRVTSARIVERLPRSAPDALIYEPGAYVQQTAHGQASVYIRGLTGQQTLMLYDGIRMNNSTYRQGPNQYFFTVDSQTVSSLEIVRGSASVLYGSDALGGVIMAIPREPLFLETVDRFRLVPRTLFRMTTADDERGGRLEMEAQLAQRLGFVGGVGWRRVGLLEAGGIVYGIDPERDAEGNLLPPEVPRIDEESLLQAGTGFDELTFDSRLVLKISEEQRLTAAVMGYHQNDAPRTDQCPPAFAPYDECLTYEEQYRELAYVAYDADLGPAAEELRLSLSYQRQHERKRLDRPSSFVTLRGTDNTHTLGFVARARTLLWQPREWVGLRLRYGTDFYSDWVSSESSTSFSDVGVSIDHSRGLYINGSNYLWWGLYTEGEVRFPFGVALRAGIRLAVTAADAPADEASASLPVDQVWVTPVGRGGLEWSPLEWLTLLFNIDQGFRSPNLDDLTSRQQTGPGFQFENAGLEPERSLAIEPGLRIQIPRFRLETSFFWIRLDNAIIRAPREADDCPPSTPQCLNSWNRFQLVNATDSSFIYGAEALLSVRIPGGFTLRATVSYAFGEGPNPGEKPSDPTIEWDERMPLSRIPPLNGTAELRWHWREEGVFAGAGLRWALAQDRLALSDISDERIPPGGTPGYVVLALRAGYRFRQNFQLALVFDNVTNAAYRVHGSSINGPARGLILQLEASL